MVGSSGLEPPTSRLSGVRSNRLSYEPILIFRLWAHGLIGTWVYMDSYWVSYLPINLFAYLPILMVEMRRFELLTPCLQGRCSPNWATPPYQTSLLYSFWVWTQDLELRSQNFLARLSDLILSTQFFLSSEFLALSLTKPYGLWKLISVRFLLSRLSVFLTGQPLASGFLPLALGIPFGFTYARG